jgi:hypothetical protein
MEISVKLPNNLYQDISHLAQTKKKSVAAIIQNAVRQAVTENTQSQERPLAGCSDSEVLALANLKMSGEQADRQSELLYKNQAGTITPLERNELEGLTLIYQLGNLRKSQGIAEAVRRGLIKTPDDLL